MNTGYQILDQEVLYYCTFQIVKWVVLFTRRIYRDIVIESFLYCQNMKGLELYAYVIMSNHIHVIVKAKPNFKLSNIIRDFKKYTAHRFLEEINTSKESRKDWILKRFEFAASEHSRNSQYQIWTHENHAIVLYSTKFITQKLNYIHENPVRAGLVDYAENYLYSSARNYSKLSSMIKIDLL